MAAAKKKSAAKKSGAKKSAAKKGGARKSAAKKSPVELDRVIHERVRLAIVSALAGARSLSFNELKTLLDKVNVEDRACTEKVYRGVSAGAARPGHLSHLERPNYDFAQYLAEKTGGFRRAFVAMPD